jgi:hypothetical protein
MRRPSHTYSPVNAISKDINNADAISAFVFGIANATYAHAKPVRTNVRLSAMFIRGSIKVMKGNVTYKKGIAIR